MPQHLTVLLGRNKDLLLKFRLRDTPVANLWIDRMQSRGDYPLDHPDRFYGFGTLEQEHKEDYWINFDSSWYKEFKHK
jgi:hypothetical protein